jgi:DNA-binding CsgD family transcriptional regulator
MVQAARAALATLTPEQRQVVCLKFLDGLSNQETAVVMKKNIGAVKALQYRALKALRHELRRLDGRIISPVASMPVNEIKKEMDPFGPISIDHQRL